ncbi:hypothetical protein EXIGLDRAFT_767534 [Exidia glandulosa HHB12029]|uniref:Uncharacterized protein n=1 Tax=Exidia glandulosa HHB12029 TaxID=1314781 RepID=A0A165IWT4_EXIGL|nr:hypothetical protein EXIGLDRAFT_767534 [Exidia glandulosa HHB12029]
MVHSFRYGRRASTDGDGSAPAAGTDTPQGADPGAGDDDAGGSSSPPPSSEPPTSVPPSSTPASSPTSSPPPSTTPPPSAPSSPTTKPSTTTKPQSTPRPSTHSTSTKPPMSPAPSGTRTASSAPPSNTPAPSNPQSSPSATTTSSSLTSPTSSGAPTVPLQPQSSGSTSTVPFAPTPNNSDLPSNPILPSDTSSTGTDSQGQGHASPPNLIDSATQTKMSKVVPILLPSLLVPLALVAVLILIVRHRRRQHRAMVDEFTNRSTMYDGGTPLMLNRNPSYASSSRYAPSQPGHSNFSHSNLNSPGLVTQMPSTPVVIPPTPRSAKFNRQSDDFEFKCAGRTNSAASLSGIYDAYGPGANVDSELAYAQDATAPAASAPVNAPRMLAPPMAMAAPPQQRSNFFQRPQFMRASAADLPAPAPAPTPTSQKPDWSRNPVTGAPRLELALPTFEFSQYNNRAKQVETPSPISAVWKSEDPFAQPPPALPAPPRVSNERRAARTRSVEQRLMLALVASENANGNSAAHQ